MIAGDSAGWPEGGICIPSGSDGRYGWLALGAGGAVAFWPATGSRGFGTGGSDGDGCGAVELFAAGKDELFAGIGWMDGGVFGSRVMKATAARSTSTIAMAAIGSLPFIAGNPPDIAANDGFETGAEPVAGGTFPPACIFWAGAICAWEA